MKNMNIEYRQLDELIPYDKNPRKNDAAVEAVAKSIQTFGFRVPIILDDRDVIIAGHTRFKAAKMLNLEWVPVLVADDLTEEEVKAYRLADNKTQEFAAWDLELLASELQDISTIDMGAFGFSMDLPDLPLDLDEPTDEAHGEQIHCPKCGFVFER
ncbi:MAG: ParB N-terminal domain-containing protein [Clostridia bacterium]|nr:ParB N-terminal domain-containing protein [Clostridia bacterium]